MSGFTAGSSPETITAICVGVGTIIGAIATCGTKIAPYLKKLRGTPFRDIGKETNKQNYEATKKAFEELGKTIKAQTEIIKTAIEKDKEKK